VSAARPRVSVLMTSYNPGPYLKPALDSILAQTLTDFELVVVEDGSTDGSKALLHTYAAADARIRLHDLGKNIGRTPALNLGLSAARGDYVAVLDADDLAAPDRLAREAELLDRRPDVVLVGSFVRFVDDSNTVLGVSTPPTDATALSEALAYSNPFPHSSVMYRRRAALAAGGYPKDFAYAQDFALWIALAGKGAFAMIDAFLAEVREHRTPTRLAVSPQHLASRARDGVILYRRARKLPGLSAAARQRGRVFLAGLRYGYAREFAAAGRWGPALRELAGAFGAAPLHCLGRLFTRRAAGR